MKKLTLLTTALTTSCILFCVNAIQAQAINFDVPGGETAANGQTLPGGVTSVNYSGQGAYQDAPNNTNWNPIVPNGTTPPGTNSDGVTVTPITFTEQQTSIGTDSAGSPGTPQGLEYLYANAGAALTTSVETCSLNNVPAGTYNLYLYGKDDDNDDADRGTTFTVNVGATNYGSLSTTNYYDTGFTLYNDYVVFNDVVVPSAGTITFTYTANPNANSNHDPNDEGNFNGLQLVVAILATNLATVTNSSATGISATSATLGGSVLTNGGSVVTVTTYYGTNDGGTNAGAWANSVSQSVTIGAFSQVVSGLSPATVYYFTSSAANAIGTAWATPSLSFTTPATLAAVTNLTVTGILATSATIGGSVVSNGGSVPTVTMYYGTNNGGTNASAWTHSVSLGLVANGVFSQMVSSLSPASVYYFTAAAVNSAGTAWATPSQSFTTLPPVINFDVPGGVSGNVNYSGQGALSDPGNNYWNAVVTNSPYTTTGVLASDGVTASPITLTALYGSGGGGIYTGDAQGANGTPAGLFAPFEDDASSTSETDTLSNVPPGTYNLYLYGNNGGSGDSDCGTTFTVSSDVTSATNLSTVNAQADYDTFVQGVNYVEFTNIIVGGSGYINIAWTANAAANGTINPQTEGIFNGLQLDPVSTSTVVPTTNLPSDVLAELNSYNVVWTHPSPNGSPGSMPIGNGDITANVWVETNSGDLMMYIGKSDSWSEATRLLKVGRIRTHFSPNPFATGSPLSQTLNYYKGELDIVAGASGSQVTLRVYADANNPVIRIAASGQQNFTMSVSNEIWRSSTMTMNSSNSGSFYGVESAPTAPSESADVALTLTDRLVWYHQNASSYFDTLFTAENLNGVWTSYTDPWLNRIFGATVLATNFTVVNNQQLQSGSGTNFLVSIFPYTAQTTSESTWQSQMNTKIATVTATNEATSRTNHYIWWNNLWNRSWIFISGSASATNVTSGYLAQRWVQAIQGRGQYPIKFNGGTITYDFGGQNGDYRAWGPSYWNQNTRLQYWPMLACGDTDMIMPFFNIYTNILPLQQKATTNYYHHGGAFFPETFNIFGLYNGDNWGWNSSSATTCGDTYIKYHYQGGLETLAMMLSYYNYTQNTSFATNYIIPMATQTIRFFEDHWSVVNGKLFFYPANACEMYWSCTNSADYISGLMSDIQQLRTLPANITTPALLTEWSNVYNELPPLPMDSTGTYIKPAQQYGSPNNSENPECYPIFPYRLYGFGLGQSNFNIALATFNNRTIKTYKYDWSQDPIEEALVGLTSAAQTDVINNFNDTDSTSHYQAYWSTRNDYVPTENTGGAAMSALQYMLMQCVGNQILLLPAWPSGWNVDFKLWAPSNTSVRVVIQGSTVETLTVTPASRSNNLVEPVPAAPTGLTANGGNGQAALTWTASAGANNYNVMRSTVNNGPYTNIATGVTNVNYFDTGLSNGTTYYYVVSAIGMWGASPNSTQASVTPGPNFAAHYEGDVIANLQSTDLASSAKVWTNRTSNTNTVGNFTPVSGGNLNATNLTWNSQSVQVLNVSDSVNNAVQSALTAPAEIISNKSVSAEAWIYATAVSQQNSCAIGYGIQGGSADTEADREFNYNTQGSGGVSGDFGNYDTAWATPPAAGAWHYLAWTYNGTTVKLYLDGVFNTSNNPTALKTPSTVIGVGAGLSGGPNLGADPFEGYIACARVESGVLTASDISGNYALGPTGTPVAGTPVGLTAVAGNSKVVLTWNPPSNATNYNVKNSTNSGGPYSVVAANLTALSFTNTGLANGTTYYFVVTATNSVGESANSSQVSAQPVSMTPPQPPGGLTATPGDSQVILSWNASSNATSYAIVNSTAFSGPYALVVTNLTGLSFTNTGLSDGTTYYFMVTAVNAFGSSNSTPVSAQPMPLPQTPAGLAATPGDGQVVLSWNASANATSYNLGNSTNSGGPYTFVTNLTGLGFTNLGLTDGTIYYFVVSAANAIGTSSNSAPVSAQPMPPPQTPTGLTATPGDSQVVLAWNASTNATSYNIGNSTTPSGPYPLVATNLTGLGFTNLGLTDGTIYYFVVSAANAIGTSSNSTPVSAQPVSLTPPQFSFSVVGGQILLAWPQANTGWTLEMQTNWLGTNWVIVPASTLTNQMTFPIDLDDESVFFQLVYP